LQSRLTHQSLHYTPLPGAHPFVPSTNPPPSWNQHHVSLQHPVNPNTVEGSMVIMPAHPHHPTQNGLGLTTNAYHHSKLENTSPTGTVIQVLSHTTNKQPDG